MAKNSLPNLSNFDNPNDVPKNISSIYESPRIYVACLAAYVSGYLHGVWIDASQDVKKIHGDVQKMLSKSPVSNAEEWAIHDFEGFGSLSLGEYESLEKVHELATFVVEHSELGAELIGHYGNLEDAQEAMENNYHGEHNSELDFSTKLFDEIYLLSIPPAISYYIDYKAFSRDVFISDYFSVEVGGKIHVFSQY